MCKCYLNAKTHLSVGRTACLVWITAGTAWPPNVASTVTSSLKMYSCAKGGIEDTVSSARTSSDDILERLKPLSSPSGLQFFSQHFALRVSYCIYDGKFSLDILVHLRDPQWPCG